MLYIGEMIDGDHATVRSKVIIGRNDEVSIDFLTSRCSSAQSFLRVSLGGRDPASEVPRSKNR